MNQNANAPFWVRALIIAGLGAAAIPVWLWIASWSFWWLALREASVSPSMFTWAKYFAFYHALDRMHQPLFVGAITASAVILSPLALLLLKSRSSQYGQARFATISEIRGAGLFKDNGDGIIIGRIGNRYLTAGKDDFPHVMLAAPTGSGKGVGVVLPNLFNWNHSVIVLDIKKENWVLTAGFRKAHGHAVFLFDPASPERLTHRWNPLAYVRSDAALRVDDVQKIGNILFPDVAGMDPIWSASCRSLFLGTTLYLFETDGKVRSLGQVAREVMSGSDKRFEQVLEAAEVAGKPYSVACASSLLDYVNTADNTRTSIRKTFTSRLELFLNPIIDAATCANDFDFRELRKKRVSIYLGITPDNLARLAPLVNLFFQQIVDINTRELPEHNATLKYQCLLLLDEFRSLGKVPLIVEAVAFLRGYGVRLMPIFQSPTQISEVYGQDAADTFYDNFNARIVFTPTNQKAAESISRELGTFTYQATTTSKPLALSKGSRSQSESEHSRALLLPQEVKEIGSEEEIIFAVGRKPIRAQKIRWHQESAFMHRVVKPPQINAIPLSAFNAVDHADFEPAISTGVPDSDFQIDQAAFH
jgi:type IV secretion system protein VirD4